ncbi:unnamed protein product [Zymoseptoria tritici ST99CH_1E4]|uniref:Rhodopsin domain-containing protein n=1 Tax=Zymoseptoria tritici ST99CH_1E4 TaxID=1276532 RepID=A0A2H1H4B4_ZYMTR|nr:unnamed protein product [Zymoseptoria tritici ST99CH_1E4]
MAMARRCRVLVGRWCRRNVLLSYPRNVHRWTVFDRYGFGRDLWMVSIPDFKMWSKMFFVLQPLYVFNAYFAKFSLLLLYLRIWPAADSRNHKFRLLCKAIGVFTFLAGISTLLAVIFACHPITVAMRKPNRAGGACIDRIGLNYTVGGINIILDILVIAMPIPRLLKLKISTIQKLGVICCFLVGFAVTGCSIYRLTHLHQLTTIRNATWDFIQLAQWSIIEVTCQMISICMPAMAGCLRRTFTFVRAKSSLASSRDRINSFEMITEKTSKGSDYSEGESRDVVSPAPMMYSADEQGRIVKSTLRPYLSAV